MPRRNVPLIINEYYHVFNRGINRQPIFRTPGDYKRASIALNFYQHTSPPLKLSHFLTKSLEDRKRINKEMSQSPKQVEILCYCLMPNHFHLLLEQKTDNGISKFLANFQNSYSKFFNAKHKRQGSLLQRQFKSVPMETENQLFHLARYIVLNPYSSKLIKTPEKSLNYPHTGINYQLLEKAINTTKDNFNQSVIDQSEYQQELEAIKHLTIE